jgi:hypothetical protein
MRIITFSELLAVMGLDVHRLKVLRQREQIALSFGRSDAYNALNYLPLDAVAHRLADVLAEKLPRPLAAEIVRDQWGIWSRVVAVAEAAPAGMPVLFYVVEYEDQKKRRGHMTLGSTLDSRDDGNLLRLAADIQKRTGVIARSYVAVEMGSILADVRAAASKARVDFSASFLPPLGSEQLAEVLKPYDDSAPDRAVVITPKDKAEASDAAKRAGIMGRAIVESRAIH